MYSRDAASQKPVQSFPGLVADEVIEEASVHNLGLVMRVDALLVVLQARRIDGNARPSCIVLKDPMNEKSNLLYNLSSSGLFL